MHFKLFGESLYKMNMFTEIQVIPECQEHSSCIKLLGTVEIGIKFCH